LIAAIVLIIRPAIGINYEAEYVNVVSFIILIYIMIVHVAFVFGKSLMKSIYDFSTRESLYRPLYSLIRAGFIYVMVIDCTPEINLNVKKLKYTILFILIAYVVLYIIKKYILRKILHSLNFYIDIEKVIVKEAYKDLLIPEEITNSYSVVYGEKQPVNCTIQLRIVYSAMYIKVVNKQISYSQKK